MATYSAKDVHITFGPYLITGYAEDSFVDVDYNDDAMKLTVGCGGEYVRSQTNNLSAKVKIRLLDTALANTLLYSTYVLDRFTKKGALPLVIVNSRTGTSHSGAAWISKPPSQSYAMESKSREWELESGSLEFFIGSSVVE